MLYTVQAKKTKTPKNRRKITTYWKPKE